MAHDGMRSVLVALVALAASVVHLARLQVPETTRRALGKADEGHGVDLRGTVRLVRGVPGLVPLIAFSCFNNLLGGTLMALVDACGLSLASVRAWGLLRSC